MRLGWMINYSFDFLIQLFDKHAPIRPVLMKHLPALG